MTVISRLLPWPPLLVDPLPCCGHCDSGWREGVKETRISDKAWAFPWR